MMRHAAWEPAGRADEKVWAQMPTCSGCVTPRRALRPIGPATGAPVYTTTEVPSRIYMLTRAQCHTLVMVWVLTDSEIDGPISVFAPNHIAVRKAGKVSFNTAGPARSDAPRLDVAGCHSDKTLLASLAHHQAIPRRTVPTARPLRCSDRYERLRGVDSWRLRRILATCHSMR